MTSTPERAAPPPRDPGIGPTPARRARWAALAAVGLVIVPLVYAVAVLTPVGQRLEDAALGGVRETDLFGSDAALGFISIPVILLLVVVMAAVGLARRRLGTGIGAGIVVLASAGTSTVLKRIADRPEIAGSTTPNSFPSGHATIAVAALFGVLMVTPRRFRPVVALLGTAYAVFVANQTVVYGWHRVSDIVGACAVCLFWLGFVRAVGPRVDRGATGDRPGPRVLRRTVTLVLVLVASLGVVGAGVAGVVALTNGGASDRQALLLAGRMVSSACVVVTVLVVWTADGDGDVGRADVP